MAAEDIYMLGSWIFLGIAEFPISSLSTLGLIATRARR